MKTNEDFHSVDKEMSDEITVEQKQYWIEQKQPLVEQKRTWTEECQACNGTGQTPRRFEGEIVIITFLSACESCSGKGEIEYEW